MPSKLECYQDTLTFLGDHRLALITDDVEARYALDNSWDRAVAFVFQAAFWRFALTTATLTHNGALTALPGYTSTFAKPSNFYRPHALYTLSGARECPVDARQMGILFHANTSPIYIRYINSTNVADPTTWPIPVAKAVSAYLAFEVASRLTQDPQGPQIMFGLWEQYFAAAQTTDAVPADPWLDHQLAGRFLPVLKATLEDGYWRFAVKTVEISANVGTPSSGYGYSFTRPADWIRTFEVYETANRDGEGIDFREEEGQYHADYTPITVRYVSVTLGVDASRWSSAFEDALLAQLALRRAMETPGTPGAVLQSLAMAAKQKIGTARSQDDTRERPRVNGPSRFIQGRYGYGWPRNTREHG